MANKNDKPEDNFVRTEDVVTLKEPVKAPEPTTGNINKVVTLVDKDGNITETTEAFYKMKKEQFDLIGVKRK